MKIVKLRFHIQLKIICLIPSESFNEITVATLTVNRDFKQWRRLRQEKRLEKIEFIFYRQLSYMPRSVQYIYRSQNLPRLNV